MAHLDTLQSRNFIVVAIGVSGLGENSRAVRPPMRISTREDMLAELRFRQFSVSLIAYRTEALSVHHELGLLTVP